MALTEDQLFAISVTERVCSAISLTSACAAMSTYLICKKCRKPIINRLIFYALLGNIVLDVATLIARSAIPQGTQSSLCQIQAFLIQWFFPADAIWALCIAWNVYLIVLRGYDYDQLRQLEWIYVPICYLLPFIPAFTFLFIETAERGKVYGPAVIECWISTTWDILRIAALYGPVWFFIVLIFVIYIRVGLLIYSRFKQLLQVSSNHSGIEGPHQIESFSTTDRYEMTVAVSLQCEESRLQRQETAVGSFTLTTTRDSMHSNLDTAAYAYLRYAFLFFIALLVTWVPSSANRLSTLINPDYVSFGLQYTASFVIPLQGFWNSLIFFNISRRECKALFIHTRDDIALKVKRLFDNSVE
ncbi:hypothetical protein BGW36DRAFT_376004 [Talaromyces proteolyticus]|uniref:G-protein coupled receptors family 2 profile 2 domain-containing protein n=1 Tax=Talaromyces proteolyticus TaxID=1131652 RepID=A0AAD4PWQ7_9EURO|nr:uncharacterized protein BGW36DRAFT_376004 [Talaromyces proteolyticus]KAH8698397.1 hypothetical protein BGW36DRAFT_376004 [Talaromyces proteolyticus]